MLTLIHGHRNILPFIAQPGHRPPSSPFGICEHRRPCGPSRWISFWPVFICSPLTHSQPRHPNARLASLIFQHISFTRPTYNSIAVTRLITTTNHALHRPAIRRRGRVFPWLRRARGVYGGVCSWRFINSAVHDSHVHMTLTSGLQVLRNQYYKEIESGHVTTQSKFNYGQLAPSGAGARRRATALSPVAL